MTLPESDFKWRRIFSYVLSVALLALVGVAVYQITDSENLRDTAFWLMVLLWWVITYYMVAPSAEQIARIIQSARLFGSSDKKDTRHE